MKYLLLLYVWVWNGHSFTFIFLLCVLYQVFTDSFCNCRRCCSYVFCFASWFVLAFVKVYSNLSHVVINFWLPLFVGRVYWYLFIQNSMWDMGFHLPVNLFCFIACSVPNVTDIFLFNHVNFFFRISRIFLHNQNQWFSSGRLYIEYYIYRTPLKLSLKQVRWKLFQFSPPHSHLPNCLVKLA